MLKQGIEFRLVSPEWERPLAAFFRTLRETGDERLFHPHPFNDEQARVRAHYRGLDLYYIIVQEDQVLGYGMLRGWEEGYAIPSLGISIHPAARGEGLGKCLMHFLHGAARRRGAKRVRLKVYRDNQAAVSLYEKMGYRFESEEGGQLVGFLDLG